MVLVCCQYFSTLYYVPNPTCFHAHRYGDAKKCAAILYTPPCTFIASLVRVFVCPSSPSDLALSGCKHTFHKECITDYVDQQNALREEAMAEAKEFQKKSG